MYLKIFTPAIVIIILILSCNHAPKEKEISSDMMLTNLSIDGKNEAPEEQEQKIPLGILQTIDTTIVPVVSATPVANIDWDKKIIKNATLKVEVKEFKRYTAAIHNMVRKFGGYIAQEEQHFTDEQIATDISIKVPVAFFEPMMNELSADSSKIIERNITSQDVTGELIDTRSRVEAKKQVRLKYLDFLKSSGNMADALKVQAEVNRIQEEIEAAAGRIDYLSHQSAYSTIHLNFYQPLEGFNPTNTSPSFLTRISAAFGLGISWLSDLLIAIVSIWPLLLLLAGGVFMYKKLRTVKTVSQKS